MTDNLANNETEDLYQKIKNRDEKHGYFLNPDDSFTKDLVQSLVTNEKRYGYGACPCRLATGKREEDLDIICPCDYRDPDLTEFDTCFCGLYVSQKLIQTNAKIRPIPDRRLIKERVKMDSNKNEDLTQEKLSFPIWRCSVCGYICARDDAPEICPICGASHDRFEIFVK
jgi:ferredoxin-thioredoxin reductase catalytic subunit